MNSNEVVSVILVAAATWFTLIGFGAIIGMIQSFFLPGAEVFILKIAFRIPRDTAILALWVGLILGFYGVHTAILENKKIQNSFLMVFPTIAAIGTALAYFLI